MGPHYPDTKLRQRHYQKKKKERKYLDEYLSDDITSMFDKYGYKNPQQNTSKLNLTIPKIDHTL